MGKRNLKSSFTENTPTRFGPKSPKEDLYKTVQVRGCTCMRYALTKKPKKYDFYIGKP